MASSSSASTAAPERRSAKTGAWIELAGYLALAVALVVILVLRVRHVDGFYLDEWLYTQGAEHMWDNLPLGPFEQIQGWTRGPQRLYTWLLAIWWGPLSPSDAFTASHIMNVALLVSAIIPAALLARRIIESSWLRVLAVALAVAVPWLVISANLLTENLAFPVFLWTVYAIIVAAEHPRPRNQVWALAGILALTLCRLNLAVMFGVFVLVVIAAELRRRHHAEPAMRTGWASDALRRELLVVVATVFAILAGIGLLATGASSLGAYGAFTDTSILDAVWGNLADDTGRAILTYVRSVATGSFILPLVLGLATAFAGARGRLGDRLFIPAFTALASLVAVVVFISVWNVAFGALEERYAFYVYSPLAILAVAGLPHLRRIVPELIAAGAVTALALGVGIAFPGVNSGNFFAAPAGAFWSRVVDHRLRSAELDFLDWLPGAGNGWLLVALGLLVALAVVLLLLQRHARVVLPLVAVGLGLCVVAQGLAMDYDYKKLLYGPPEAPGGIAMGPDRSLDRDDWIDDALPDDAVAAIIPAVTNPAIPYGDAERQQFWNESLNSIVAMRFNGAPTPDPPGFGIIESTLDPQGLASWVGPRPRWFVAQPDDPRVQFAGKEVARSENAPFAVWRAKGSRTAVWTSADMDPDGGVLEDRPVTMTLDRERIPDVRAVTLDLLRPPTAVGPVRWKIEPVEGGRSHSGRAFPDKVARVTLRVPACRSSCEPVAWRLSTTGTPTELPQPYFGPAPPARPVMLYVTRARLD